jgi:phosphatidylinositol alpha-1,6-mannosyltransferase
MPKKIVLLTLQTFSTTGGIQKMTRTMAHSLTEIATRNKWSFRLWSVHDKNEDVMTQYIPAKDFKGFGVKRMLFTIQSPKLAITSNVVILSHINLATIGLIIKLINPKCKIWLIAHGIEVWRDLSFIKMRLLQWCDKVICVSNFTKQEVIRLHRVDADKCYVLNNAIDSLMKLPDNFIKPQYLLDRYNLNKDDLVLFTLTRLAATEQYKGYEQVIKIINKLKLSFPTIKYVLSGQYDDAEEVRIKHLIHKYQVEDQVILTGFIAETEISDHFLLADLFILPSKKEGFGIVFIEALACGLPVICGNSDGSVDAIRNGELGKAIKTDDLDELEKAITESLATPLSADDRKNLQKQCLLYFNEPNYREHLHQLLMNE